MARKRYALTPAHRAQLAPWAERWIANALSTRTMDDAERARAMEAVEGLYRAAGLTPPPRHRIIFVPSPFVARFAGGFAAAIWYGRKGGPFTDAATFAATDAATFAATVDATRAVTVAATRAATDDATVAATVAATRAATFDATVAATVAATFAATFDATRAATVDATVDATDDATRAATVAATVDATTAATDAATRAATVDATDDATRAATVAATSAAEEWYTCGVGGIRVLARQMFGDRAPYALACAQNAWQMWNGGNQYSAWAAYLSFFRHVAQLPLDYSKWAHYETLAECSGPRVMHAEFCIISDRPERLTVDAEHRPHNDFGPFCRWRDGSALYAIHGVRVPAWLVESPERLTPARITAEANAEVRRVMLERYGLDRYLRDVDATVVDSDRDQFGRSRMLRRAALGDDEPLVMVTVSNSTAEPDGAYKSYTLRVPPETASCAAAVAWTFGLDAAHYVPAQES